MRRTTLGLAAAAVIAGSLGFGGVAKAGVGPVTLNVNNSVTAGSDTWVVQTCTYNGAGGCSDLAMTATGTGVTVSGWTGSAVEALSKLDTGGVSDFSVTLVEYTSPYPTGAATISSATLTAVGTTNGGSASVSTKSGSNVIPLGTIGFSGSGYGGAISFSPVNNVTYNMDVPLTLALTSVSYGTPVPEPSAIAVFGFSLLLLAGVRTRGALRTRI